MRGLCIAVYARSTLSHLLKVAVFMNAPQTQPPPRANAMDRLGLNRLLQVFLTIIAGAVVAVIAWTIIVRFSHIIILLIASFILAYLIAPLVNHLEKLRVPRLLSAILVYLVIFGVIGFGAALLAGPLVTQIHQAITSLPTYFNPNGKPSGIERYLAQHGVDTKGLRQQAIQAARGASGAILSNLGNTFGIVAGTIAFITDVLLILVITFYFVLDGHAMRNRAVRLLPESYRGRWFFVEAALNTVLGGYLRGQVIVAATVGAAAGVGCFFIGVQFPIVIGLLAFLFEFIPMLGPVLGMIPAVIISLFQAPTPVVVVIIYFIVLQQVESNLIVPRISGHAVGLHPLAALLALIAGLDLGGIGGALLAVPAVGVLYVLVSALYSDARGQSRMLVNQQPPRRRPYTFLARQITQRRGRGPVPPQVVAAAQAQESEQAPVANERLASIQQESEHLQEQFEADQVEQDVAEAVEPDVPPYDRQAPNDAKEPPVNVGG